MDEAKTQTIVVVGNGCWGKGNTLAEAKSQFRREGGRLTLGYGIMTFDQETVFHGIDRYGRYEYVGNAPQITKVKGR